MYSLDELKQQNQEIAQLCDVLSVLMDTPSLRANPFVDELLARFRDKVWMHLVFEDNAVYAGLLKSNNQVTIDTAKAFHDSAVEIKHRFTGFIKQWRTAANTNAEHETHCKDCREIFSMIRDRIDYENNQIFPLIS